MSTFEHSDIKRFAADQVNLPADKATAHRQQATALRDRLTCKIAEDPAFDLVRDVRIDLDRGLEPKRSRK